MKIAILGSGTSGTALANAFIKKHDVSVYSRFEEESLKLRTSRVHPNLKGAILDEKIVFSSDLKEVIKDDDLFNSLELLHESDENSRIGI